MGGAAIFGHAAPGQARVALSDATKTGFTLAMLDVPRGQLYVGGAIDGETGERIDQAVLLDSSRLTTHGVIVGMTGSGKTGLGIVLLEEAQLAGIPTLVIDPKGDMGNLALRFPDCDPSAFRPWIDESEAQRDGVEPEAFAAKVAGDWKQGLESWHIGRERFDALTTAGQVTIYTPGSTAGRSLGLLGSPVSSASRDLESVRDEIEAYVSGLLALAGIDADPLSSPEHVLLATLLENGWKNGQAMDLPTLVLQLQEPPVRKLGVFDVDRFFPKKDRNKLAMKLNALLASPSFASWLEGEPLDVGSLLFTPEGKPRCAILYLQHLSDAERMLVVTLTLSKVVTWMRNQSGTSGLRALIYMDEVFGYAPPTAAPPSKKPLLTILKQARAFGVGLVLSTQNPVDLDYKALANAGTWLIGRLQTDRDRGRMIEGLRSALGLDDAGDLAKLIGGLGKRQYVLHQVGEAPRSFTSRWAMSYLRGPLTREEVRQLSAPAAEAEPAARAAPAPPAVAPPPAAPPTAEPYAAPTGYYAQSGYAQQAYAQYPQHSQHGHPGYAPQYPGYPAQAHPPQPYPPQPVAPPQASAPPVAPGVSARFVDPGAPWLVAIGAAPAGLRLAPALVGMVDLRFDERAIALDHTEPYEVLIFPLAPSFDPSRVLAVDHDPRDFRDDAPPGRAFVSPEVPLGDPSWLEGMKRALTAHLHACRSVAVFRNAALGLVSRVGEERASFDARCRYEADQRADAEAAKLRDKFANRVQKLQDALQRAQISAADARADAQLRQQQSYIQGAGALVSMFMGGRSGVRGLAGAASRQVAARRQGQRVDQADRRVQDKRVELERLEQELAGSIAEIAEKWDRAAAGVTPVEVRLEADDIHVRQLFVAWVPVM